VILRQPWSLKTIGIDAVLAMIAAVIAGYILVNIEVSRGIWDSVMWPVWVIAAASVIAMHLLRQLRLRH
jgi:hypothetical protein